MKIYTWVNSLGAVACLGFAYSAVAGEGATGLAAGPTIKTSTSATPEAVRDAQKCLGDLRAFKQMISKDGYGLGGSRYGYGYAVGTSGYGWYSYPDDNYPASDPAGAREVRPGYEIRALLASANIMARHGQQEECETLLTTSRGIYQNYVSGLHRRSVPISRMEDWEQHEIASAQPVIGENISFNSDQLVGIEIRNPQNKALGSVHDIVMSPQTGKIAYLVVGRGGVFGIDEKYVPVPWADFKVTANVSLLVLAATPSAMKGAPEVSESQLDNGTEFDAVSTKIDAYWKISLSSKNAD